ncbi:hypothetical protein NPIL_321131 [Nephila pilipes]|uniref:Integrase catalytic domain-containing protein n=1 Tax=Nephila pilipes TaxID=299642 RepID=A0A8X6T0Q1_NEPPI|nr:hypothetical protein NPIL_321131 [Nephila pilipes]
MDGNLVGGIPKATREKTLIACHDDVGHMGAKNSEQFAATLLVATDAKGHQIICPKLPQMKLYLLITSSAYRNLEVVTSLLVQIDHTPRYVITRPSAFLAAHTVIGALYLNIILRYGLPRFHLSYGGTAFTMSHAQRFWQKSGITQSMIPPYSPQANTRSIFERGNGIIASTLKK